MAIMATKSILDFFQSDSGEPSSSLHNETERERIEVRKALEHQTPVKRGKYKSWTAKDRAEIGKYACNYGNKATKVHFATKHPGLTRQTIDNFKRYYKEEKQKNKAKTSEGLIRIHPGSVRKQNINGKRC